MQAVRAHNDIAICLLVHAACDGNVLAPEKLKIIADELMDTAVRCMRIDRAESGRNER